MMKYNQKIEKLFEEARKTKPKYNLNAGEMDKIIEEKIIREEPA